MLAQTPLEVALFWIKKGRAPIPVPYQQKTPLLSDWQHLQLTEETAPHYFNGEPQNIGLLLGDPSKGLVDIDLDCPEAVAIAPWFFPATATFGRPSAPESHLLFVCPGLRTQKYQADIMLLEIRSTGCQTVMPGSVHPSGEPIAFVTGKTKLRRIDADNLLEAAGKTAAAALLAQQWKNKQGSRHDCTLALAGALCHSGWESTAVTEFVQAITSAAGDDEAVDRLAAVQSTAEKYAAGEAVSGWPTLAELFDDKTIKRLRKWLRITNDALTRPPTPSKIKQESTELFPAMEPWPESVSGQTVLEEAAAFFRHYLVLPPHADTVLALWCLHAHSFECFEHSPRLNVTSPEKRSGKTLVIDLLQCLTPKALRTENLSTAVLFRLIDRHHPTLLVDECDTFLANNEELRGCLNAGHKRGGQFLRCVGDQHEAKVFKVFGPVVLAGIRALPGTLHDRSIVVALKRATATELAQVQRFDSRTLMPDNPLNRKLARWAQDNQEALQQADPAMPVHSRLADNWRPLFAIAELCGWQTQVMAALYALTDTEIEDDSISVQLLKDIQQVFTDAGTDKLFSEDLTEALWRCEDSPWADWSRGQPLTKNKLAGLLKPFKVKPKDIRIGSDVKKGYRLDWFDDVFARYLPVPTPPAQTATPLHPSNSKGFSDSQNATSENRVAFQKPMNINNGAGCSGVAVQTGGYREDLPRLDKEAVMALPLRSCLHCAKLTHDGYCHAFHRKLPEPTRPCRCTSFTVRKLRVLWRPAEQTAANGNWSTAEVEADDLDEAESLLSEEKGFQVEVKQ